MRNRWNQILLVGITALTIFSILVVWPGWPKRYLPDFIDYPEGPIIEIGNRVAMKLGLDLKGGTYVLTEADFSGLPPGTNLDEAMEGAKDIIERRVNEFGVSETEVTREGQNRLAVQLPGISPEEAADLIGRTALLEFREPVLDAAGLVTCISDTGAEFTVGRDTLTETTTSGTRRVECIGPDGVSGSVKWKPATGTSRGQARVLTGRFLKSNGVSVDVLPGQGPVVNLVFTGEGGIIFQQVTERLVGYPLAIFLDDELISAPNVQQVINSGNSVINGLELDEAKTLAIQLNAGALPVPLRTIQTTEVDATLGETTLIRAVQAGLIGILAVMAFMVLYYRLPGVLACLALIVYTSTVMMLFKLGPIIGPVTITLSGIAGFVLSVGMAVDANILVFERMKEELRAGRALPSAIEHGFDRAWSSIRDSNVATIITCVILWWFGDQFGASLVQGFALTLGIGVLVSMFSAIVVTRTFLRLLVGTPLARNMSLFAPDLRISRVTAAGPFVFDFVRRRGLYFAISAAILVPGIISLAVPPALNAGIEFSSGATMTVVFDDASVSQDRVGQALADIGHDEARVQKTSGGGFIIRLGELEGPVGPPVGAAPPSERDEIEAGLEEALGAFRTTNFNQVSEIVSREIARNAAIAIGVASIAILLYISISFRNVPKAYRYGIAAVVAALHDAVFILGAFSIFGKLFGMEINSMFITGLLTVIGFSVHDTIVVFDRIRENVAANPGVAFDEVVNTSLTETVARSINTSTTVILTIVALLLLGGGNIEVLLLTLLLGIIAGTYSSIFIASQILVAWEDGDFASVWRRIWPRRAIPAEAPQP
ncbi:MAG TPA: protein translocase subunit SecD [Dehalococcoidia bacterium]|nr:protein translocase subunit SecD [Dehalococcoidia bacterium]